MKILGVDHIQITIPVGAEDEARAFYLDFLGLREMPKPDSLQERGGFWMLAAGMPIHVGVEDGFDRQTTRAHIAYAVDDIEICRTALAARGVSVVDDVPIYGQHRFSFRDPFGNRVELIELPS